MEGASQVTNSGSVSAMADPTQDEYFSSYEDVEIHRLMVNDKPRTSAYKEAINKNKHLIKGKIVMDVGAGTGILSLFMAAAGAKKVYAVEASGIATVIEKIARDNGYENVIEVLHSKVEDITLPNNEKVDFIISEWMGFYLLHESMLNSVINVRDRFLSEDGTIFPSEARIYACPCSLHTFYKEQIDFWNNVYNFNMSAVREYALKSKMIKPEVCLVPKLDLLAEPTCVKKFNLRWVTEDDVKSFSETTFVGITRSGVYQGLCLWFECDFDGCDYDENGERYGSLITLSTSPYSRPTHWKQTVVVLGNGANQQVDLMCEEDDSSDDTGNNTNKKTDQSAEASCSKNDDSSEEKDDGPIDPVYEVDEDEVIGWKLVFCQSDDNVRHYTMTVEMLDPETEEHPIPCACPTPRCVIIAKMMENEEMGEEDPIDCIET